MLPLLVTSRFIPRSRALGIYKLSWAYFVSLNQMSLPGLTFRSLAYSLICFVLLCYWVKY